MVPYVDPIKITTDDSIYKVMKVICKKILVIADDTNLEIILWNVKEGMSTVHFLLLIFPINIQLFYRKRKNISYL